MATSIRVALAERSYDIEIGRGTLARAAELLGRWRPKCRQAAIITDQNVAEPHAEPVAESLRCGGLNCHLLVVKAGEASKCVAEAERLWLELARLKFDRQAVVVAIGGGVVGDLAGFVAATFARGLALVQVPTSLLAQVDSSVGGKVGINLPAAKNIVGAFWQPAGVLIDLNVLTTLPDREYRSGLAEVVKYGVILDAEFFEYLEGHVGDLIARRPDVLEHVIARCCQLKAGVVERDEREESGLRAVLNYGHTFCHALETVTGYGRYLHGEAVAVGMVCASRLAESIGWVDSTLTDRQRELLMVLGLPVEIDRQGPPLRAEVLLAAMHGDKKSEQGRLRFVLPRHLGHVELMTATSNERVLAAWKQAGAV